MDIIATGNMAPGNTIQNIANLIKPAFLIPLLIFFRRAERAPDSESHSSQFDAWRVPLLRSAPIITITVATAFAIGFALNQLTIISAIGAIFASSIVAVFVSRSPCHKIKISNS